MSFVLFCLVKILNISITLFRPIPRSFRVVCFYCNSILFFSRFDYQTQKLFDPCHYTCPKCDCLNVRDSNGDIVDHLPEMFEEKPVRSSVWRISCSQYSYSKSEVPFCATCITNREANLKALSEYDPWRCYPELGVRKVAATEFKALVDAKYPLSCKVCSIQNRKMLLNFHNLVRDFYDRTTLFFRGKKRKPRTRYLSQLTKKELMFNKCLQLILSLNFWIWNFFFIGLVIYGYFMYRDFDLLLAQLSKLTWERITHYFAHDKNSDSVHISYKILFALFTLNNTLLYCPTALRGSCYSSDIVVEIGALRAKFLSSWLSLWMHRFAHVFFFAFFFYVKKYYNVSLFLKEDIPLDWSYSAPSLILMLDLTWLLVDELMFIRVYFTLVNEAREVVDLNLPDKLMTPKVCSTIGSLVTQGGESQPMEELTALLDRITLNDFI